MKLYIFPSRYLGNLPFFSCLSVFLLRFTKKEQDGKESFSPFALTAVTVAVLAFDADAGSTETEAPETEAVVTKKPTATKPPVTEEVSAPVEDTEEITVPDGLEILFARNLREAIAALL